jgi:hypothetical protein
MSLTRYLLLFFAFFNAYSSVVVLDPAGDINYPGRRIGQTFERFERTIAQSFARDIQDYIEKKNKHITLLFSRLPGERKNADDKMRFVYQCNADFFIHLSIYQHAQLKPHMHIFYHTAQNRSFADALYGFIITGQKQTMSVSEPIGFPCHALKNLPCAAIIIELGIQDADNLFYCTSPLAEGIMQTCAHKKS